MKISVLKERHQDERRVAVSPDIVSKYIKLGYSVAVEKGAGLSASFPDETYEKAGATIYETVADVVKDATLILKVRGFMTASEGEDEFANLPEGAVTLSLMDPYRRAEAVEATEKAKLTSVAMELVPRITRAQSMDVLSSQSNLAGYRAVLEAASVYGCAFPMMMTAAGTVAPAKAMVMGAGVAGLQAIATARRLGAVVSATDVRPAAKEQVESLGASFVAVENDEFKQAETSGGYAKEMSADYQKQQAELIAKTIAKQDIVICTALIPGRPAPTLITEEMVETMKPGSVIVDMAIENGGNCTLTEYGKVIDHNGVKIVGIPNLASQLASDASKLYAKNLYNFISLFTKSANEDVPASFDLDEDDDIVQGCLLVKDGMIVHPNFKQAVSADESVADADETAEMKDVSEAQQEAKE